MDFDHRAEEKSNLIFQVWLQNLLKTPPEERAGKVASRHYPGTPVKAARAANGAFNICYRVTYDNSHRVLVRFTCLGRVVARHEKAMEKSLETGIFWICLASHHGSMFDEIYWKNIDPRFYGPFTTIEDRFALLGAEERTNIDTFVETKTKEASENTLVNYHSIVDELVDL